VNVDLGRMPHTNGARFDSAKVCLLGTRESIIREITQWVNTPGTDANSSDTDVVPSVFFLSGVAGYGKSAIAHTIAHKFNQDKRLGSSYFFDSADKENIKPTNLLSTISRDIATLDHQWKMALFNVVKGDPSLQTTHSATDQFSTFILQPAKALAMVGPIVIVIDGLDESAKGDRRAALLDTLAKGVSDLPSNFRILITARPDPDIVNAFKCNRRIFCKYINTIDEANEADITLFVEAQLSHIASLELEWPNKHWCRMLVESSDGLFQWASTACRAIKFGEPGMRETERLTRFVSSERGLDGLYSEILSQAFNVENDTVMSRFKLVMGRILAAKEPLSISAHSELRDENDPADLVGLIVPQLGSLLSGVNQEHVPIRALHLTFFEFLTDRSNLYYVDPSRHHRSLTLSSLRVMKKLRFNICGLKTSHCRNDDVPDLSMCLESAIPTHLSYGCRFWVDHLRMTAYDKKILNELREFLYERLLYWLEVLSLVKKVKIASRTLRSMLEWNQVSRGVVYHTVPN
jgi:NACHT domain